MSFFTSSSMDKLGSRLASLVSSASEKVKEAAERTLVKESPLEKNLREAVSDKNWGCATSVLSDIARASHSYSDYAAISKTMWDAIGEPPKRWRRIFKGLTMLEYMLKNGTEKFAEEARDKSYLLKVLQNFNWSEEGRDKGAGIREKAELCSTLVFDAAELKAAREIAAKNRDKYIGISSTSSLAYRGSSSSSSSSRTGATASGMGSSTRHPAERDASSRGNRGDQGTQRAGLPASSGDRKVKTRTSESSGKRGAKKSESASPSSTKPSAEKSPAHQADLLGFDSPQMEPQATPAGTPSFASGNVWADFTSAPSAASSGAPNTFASFIPPPPPAASLSTGGAPQGPAASEVGAGDDLFGGFQAAKPPTAASTGSSNTLDALAAAFAASPQASTATSAASGTNGPVSVGGGFGTSPLGGLNGTQQNAIGTLFAGSSQPASFTIAAGPAAAATPQNSQWQQPFTMGTGNNASTSTAPQSSTMGNSSSTTSSNTLPQPFSLTGSGTSSTMQQQQPLTAGSSSAQQPFFMGSGAPGSQPFTLGAGSPQPWQQQQKQPAASASSASFPSLDQGLF